MERDKLQEEKRGLGKPSNDGRSRNAQFKWWATGREKTSRLATI